MLSLYVLDGVSYVTCVVVTGMHRSPYLILQHLTKDSRWSTVVLGHSEYSYQDVTTLSTVT